MDIDIPIIMVNDGRLHGGPAAIPMKDAIGWREALFRVRARLVHSYE